MRLARTSFAADEIKSFIGAAGHNPLVENYLVQYLLISLYSEAEQVVKSIIMKRLRGVGDTKIASFISRTNDAMIKRVKKAEINDVLAKFACGEGDILGQRLEGQKLQPYFDAITNRHLVCHGDGADMTFDELLEAIECAEMILNELEVALFE
jgi:hypothetical protein